MVGKDDNGWPFGDGGGPETAFLQENGAINALPGNPVTPSDSPLASDNDYYFAGVYNTAIASNTAFYGAYTPVGPVAVNEEGAERAFAAADNDLRYHFNLPGTLRPTDTLTITFDPFNLDTGEAARPVPDPRYGVELYFNSILVMTQTIVRAGQIDTDITSAPFTLASVNAQVGPGADNIVSLRGINYNTAASSGGNWMGVDYVQLDSQVVPEPASGMAMFFGAVGVASFLRRRRA
jgi:hypothetical protein